MAWKETRVVDSRMMFISEVIKGDYSMAELCSSFDISRKTGYKWLGRYIASGPGGLADQSRRPHSHPQAIGEAIKSSILLIKKRFPHWGPLKIGERLVKEHPDWCGYPAISTIGLLLKQEGLVCSRARKLRSSPTELPLTKGTNANDVWCADFKGHFKTGDGIRCNPLTISDHVSRYLLCCRHLDKATHDAVKMQFERVFRDYGLPLVIRTDNGHPFASHGLCGLSRLSVWWIRLGIHPERIEAGKPQQNGRHERMHRTLKEYTGLPPAATIAAQQKRFDAFRQEYNNERPHESLAMKSPVELYDRSGRRFPSRLPAVEYGDAMDVRKVGFNGEVYVGGRRWFLSESLGGEYIGIEQVDGNRSRLCYCDYVLGEYNHRTRRIEPVKRYPVSAGVNPCTAHNSTKVLPMSSV